MSSVCVFLACTQKLINKVKSVSSPFPSLLHPPPPSLLSLRVIPIEGSRISASVWGPFDEFLVTGHESGEICRYDVTNSGTSEQGTL